MSGIIRNDGVTGSNPVSGTIPLSGEIQKLKRNGLPAGSEFGSYLGRFGMGNFGLGCPPDESSSAGRAMSG